MGLLLFVHSAQTVSSLLALQTHPQQDMVDAGVFLDIAASLMKRRQNFHSRSAEKKFCLVFGVSPDVCELAWAVMTASLFLDDDILPLHLLWTLVFLRHYESTPMMEVFTEAISKMIFNMDMESSKLKIQCP